MKKYKIIYADPAWKYEFGESSSRFVNKKYKVMELEDLCKLPIKDISDDDSVLLMWITFPKLMWGERVIKSWGFEYKTVAFVWIKRYDNNSIFIGNGYYTRSNAEICLLATKGDPLPRKSHSISQIIMSKVREHSRKPDEVYKKIEELFGDVPRIELFARSRREGWDAWGNQVPNETQKILRLKDFEKPLETAIKQPI